MPVYVYIIHSRLDFWYTGMSKDVFTRLEQHRSQSCISTRNKGFFEIVFFQECKDYSDARKLEVKIKQTGAYKWIRKSMFSAYLFKAQNAKLNVAYLRKKGIVLPYHLINEACVLQIA